MAREKVIQMPTSIPLIGQGPTPEQIAAMQAETLAVFKTWPVHAYPTGPNAGPFWGGETMVHKYAGIALAAACSSAGFANWTDKHLLEVAQKCWKVSIFMMQTSPFKVLGGEDAPTRSASNESVEPAESARPSDPAVERGS